MRTQPSPWPDNKAFAFTIFDDTDRATLEGCEAIYGCLRDAGIFTTKTVWMEDGDHPPIIPGVTCSNQPYLKWLKTLQNEGFEIAWHNATWEGSKRDRTARLLEKFRQEFGRYPATMANHASNEESIYWGSARFSSATGALYKLLSKNRFSGHDPSSPWFWGDLCKQHIKYVRNFTFDSLNTLRVSPWMPYHDPTRPWVNAWFSGSNGADLRSFNEILHESSLDKLAEEGGLCILYTHFGKGFYDGKSLNCRFVELIRRLGRMNGWFVPAETLLDHLKTLNGGVVEIGKKQLLNMEFKWLLDQSTRLLHR